MRLAPWLAAVLAGCTCAGEPVPEAPPEPEPAPPARRTRTDRPPVLQVVRFEVPVRDADAGTLRERVLAAGEGLVDADPEAAPEGDGAGAGEVAPEAGGPTEDRGKAAQRRRAPLDDLGAAHCREGSLWTAPGGHVGLWHRKADGSCGGEPLRWSAERLRLHAHRPLERPVDPALVWAGLDEVATWSGGTWERHWEARAEAHQEEATGAFPFDLGWLTDTFRLALEGDPASVRIERQALARLVVSGEPVTVVLERAVCGDGKELGATVSFETRRRSSGHKKTDPRDVIVAPKVQKLADALVAGLGDRVGGEAVGPEELTSCAP